MNKLLILAVAATIVLSACGQQQGAGVSDTQALVKAWISAYESKDADKYIALYSDDIYYADWAIGAFINGKDGWSSGVRSTFPEEGFGVKVNSYFISSDGRFAAVECIYSDKDSQGRIVSMPMVSILEFKNGKIVKETDYYDAGALR